jgi:glycosyltransferase involved in cell wall biosynthesis
MRIAQIAPIVERIPPKKYGGTERVIYELTEELVRRGHEVTLFASGDSITSATLVPIVPVSLREVNNKKDIYGFNTTSMLNIGAAYARHREFDVIHDHNPHISLPTANVTAASTPVVVTWHGPYAGMEEYFSALRRPHLVSISRSQAALAPSVPVIGTVYNGLSMEHYPFGAAPKDYMVYVGRIDREKGVHHAMDAAIMLGKTLIIAAKLDDNVPQIKEYFDTEIEPRLKAHPKLLNWIGEVDEKERNELFAGALCLLHAVTWPEPFGLTLIESQACGVPVIAFNQGAIPEIVRHGVTGFVVNNVEEMVSAIKRIDTIDRAACRAHALTNFSAKRMAAGYEDIYRMATQAYQSDTHEWLRRQRTLHMLPRTASSH